MFVIKRNSDGKYVAPGGQQNSYTACLQRARQFRTREEAQREACGNEHVCSALDEMMRP